MPSSEAIKIAPLGGLGEIGMNCMAIEQGDDVLVVDCGVAFPEQDLGLDVIHPDFSYLRDRASAVRGVVVTHGHEDHIGGLPYLLGHLDVPVWGPRHALRLIEHRLSERGIAPGSVDLNAVAPGQVFSVGSFEIEPIRVAHSIVEASALRIETSAGTLLHTGDFNFDPTPSDGEASDVQRLRELGDSGVGLMLSDSTNVDVETPGAGEGGVAEALDRLVREARGRLFISLFASNLQRLISLGRIAMAAGKKICLLGRSLNVQVEIGLDIGRLDWPSDLCIAPDRARSLPKESVLILASGTQGEARSAMTRLAEGTHPDMAVEAGDTVIFSSRIIPGNERGVFRMIGNLMRLGAHVVHRVTHPAVHTSGHATRLEQRRMIELLRPRCFVPVHGTLHHLTRHAELARDAGIDNVVVVENGTCVEFDGRSLRRGQGFTSGRVSIAPGGREVPEALLRERLEVVRGGLVTVVLVLDGVPARVRLGCRGVVGQPDEGGLRAVEREVQRFVRVARGAARDKSTLADDVRRLVRREFFRMTGVRPTVDVQVVT